MNKLLFKMRLMVLITQKFTENFLGQQEEDGEKEWKVFFSMENFIVIWHRNDEFKMRCMLMKYIEIEIGFY